MDITPQNTTKKNCMQLPNDVKNRDGDRVVLLNVPSIPSRLGVDCVVPSQKFYEEVCRTRYQNLIDLGIHVDEKEVERCINYVRYTFSTMRSSRLIFETSKYVVFLPCIYFFYLLYDKKWKKKFVAYLHNFVYPFYSQEDVQYLYIDREQLDAALARAHELAEQFPKLKALITNLVEYHKAMKNLNELINTNAQDRVDKVDKIIESFKAKKIDSLDSIRFHLHTLLSNQSSMFMHAVEMFMLLLVIKSLHARGYLDNEHTYLGIIEDYLQKTTKKRRKTDQQLMYLVELLKIINNAYDILSHILSLINDVLEIYRGKSKGIANTHSTAKKMLTSFTMSRLFMSSLFTRTLLPMMIQALSKHSRGKD